MSNNSLLVTGGAGFIGSNFIHYWLRHHPEDTIINLDALTYAGNLENLRSVESHPSYSFVHGSITDVALVRSLMQKVTTVVHFAAESHVDRSIKNPAVFVETNVLGTQVLLDAARDCNVKHFHHISTDEVFGSLELESTAQFTESTPYDPRSPYSASKAGSDHLVRAYGETFNLPYTITNCSNNYGPYQFPEKFMALAITNLLEDKPIPVYGDGKNVRDWLYVEDHCSAIEAVLLEGPTQKTYVVGGLTDDISNAAIAQIILKSMNKSDDMLEFINDRPGHDRRYSVDWSLIHESLNWKPSVTLEEGIQKTIEWYTQNADWWKVLKDKNNEYFTAHYRNT